MTTWADLGVIMLSEIRQTEKTKDHVTPHKTDSNKETKKHKLRGPASRLVLTWGRGRQIP